jgi:MFS family permease
MRATAARSARLASVEDPIALSFLLVAVVIEVLFFVVLVPLLPSYAHELHLGKVGAGVLSASYAIGCGAASLPAGALIPAFGARRLTTGGLATVGLACAVFAFGHDAALLDGARVAQGVGGAAVWVGAIAWMMSLGARRDRGSLIGLAFSAAGVGACIGPAVGALATLVGTRPVFRGLALLIIALAIGGAWLDTAGADRSNEGGVAASTQGVLLALGSSATRRALAIVALPSIAIGAAGVLKPLRLHDAGITTAAIAGGFFAASVLEVVVNPAVGRWYDRRGAPVVVRAALLDSLACVLLLANNLPGAALLIAVAVCWPVLCSVWVLGLAELTEAVGKRGGQIGLALGMFNVRWAVTQSLGAVGGAQLSRIAEAVPFLVLAVLYAMGVGAAPAAESLA